MKRRDVLRASGIATTTALAGCTGLFETRPVNEPPLVENRPDAVYYPTHVEGMEMIGMAQRDDRAVGLMFSYPHRFWTVTGRQTERVDITEDDSVHLMASLWETETQTILPVESGLRFEIKQDGETVTERAPWPMLSQAMGFHFGDNFPLPGDGTYTVVVDIGAMNLNRLGAFDGKFEDSGTVEIEFEYSSSERDEIMFQQFDDQQGQRGAVEPMEMDMVPLSTAPAKEALPGRIVAEAESGDANFIVTAAEVDGEPYLAVCPRTPHNRYVLPMMSLSATLERNGSTVFDGALQKAIDPERNYHYGAFVESIETGDNLTITVDAPPQVSRHEGYETAFLDMPEMTISLA
jgi:hypothetical protein